MVVGGLWRFCVRASRWITRATLLNTRSIWSTHGWALASSAAYDATMTQRVPRGLKQTPLGVSPAAGCQNPLLEDQPDQFGVDLAENPCRVFGAPFVHPSVAFPQLEEEFDLPPNPQQHHRLREAEHAPGHIRDRHIPVGQRQCGVRR